MLDTRSRKFVNPVALFASHGRKVEQTLFRAPISPFRKRDLQSFLVPFSGARRGPAHDNAHASGRLQGATRSTLGEPDVDYTLPYRAWGRFVTIKCRCPIGTPPEWATPLGPLRTFLRAGPLRGPSACGAWRWPLYTDTSILTIVKHDAQQWLWYFYVFI